MAQLPTCFKCKRPIQEQALIALGRFWHQACFTCAKCSQALDVKAAVMQGDFLFHTKCSPVATSSGGAARSRAVQAPAWMKTAVAPQAALPAAHSYRPTLDRFLCAACGQPVGLKFFVCRGSHYYHTACYIAQNTPVCDICHQPISGQMMIDSWGSIFCAYHEAALKDTCAECGRFICRELTGGGVRYQDGRLVCNLCRRTAVDTAEQVEASMKRVRDILGKNGLLIDERLFPVILLDRQQMTQRAQNISGVAGLFCPAPQVNGRRAIEAVCGLWGQPAYSFESTLAHELGHAWFYLNHVDHLDHKVQEGLCNVLKYLSLSETQSPETLHSTQSLFRNPDPVYGEGFRVAEGRLRWYRYSVGTLMRYVAQHRDLP
jgi:hypothetical protein